MKSNFQGVRILNLDHGREKRVTKGELAERGIEQVNSKRKNLERTTIDTWSPDIG